jgi:uncharacterized protein YgiM (DUF1202 family)
MFRKLILVALALGLLLTLVPAMAQGSTQPSAVSVTASTDFFATANYRLNVRSGPGGQYTVLGQLAAGSTVDITGRRADNRWTRINFNGQEGWVSTGLIDVNGNIDDAPVAEAGASAVLRSTPSDANNAKLGTVIVVTRLNANLRESYSTDAKSLVVIPFGTTLTVTGRTEKNNWVRVTYNGTTGWVSSGVLRFTQGNLDTLPFINADGVEVQPASQPASTPNP